MLSLGVDVEGNDNVSAQTGSQLGALVLRNWVSEPCVSQCW